MNATRFLIVVLFALALLTSAVVVTYGGRVETNNMNDRFAIETFSPAAHGIVTTEIVQSGEIVLKKVLIENLPSGREFEVVVTVGPDGDTGFNPVVIVESDPIEIGGNGLLKVKGFEVGAFAPGTYRVDILIFPAGEGFPRDFLQACEPAPFVTVTE